MRPDLNRIEQEISPLLEVHGVELVALDWLQGPGHGILRVYIDRPGGDPRIQDPEKSVSLEQVTDVTRDVSTAMDALDLIEGAYTLEIGSPGPERPVQKRADFDRFAGFLARIDAREERGTGKGTFNGTLRGTVDLADGAFAVRIDIAGKEHQVPAARVIRAKLHEIKAAPKPKPGKGPSKRQDRLAARERARAINAAHRAGLGVPEKPSLPGATPGQATATHGSGAEGTVGPTPHHNRNDSTAPDERNSPADERSREAKR